MAFRSKRGGNAAAIHGGTSYTLDESDMSAYRSNNDEDGERRKDDDETEEGHLLLDEWPEKNPGETTFYIKSGDRGPRLKVFIDSGNRVGPMIISRALWSLGYSVRDVDFDKMIEYKTLAGKFKTAGVVQLGLWIKGRSIQEHFHVLAPGFAEEYDVNLPTETIHHWFSRAAEEVEYNDQPVNLFQDELSQWPCFEEQSPQPRFALQERYPDDGQEAMRTISPSPHASLSSVSSAVMTDLVSSSNLVEETNPTSAPPATLKDNPTALEEYGISTIVPLNDDTETVYSDFSDSHNAKFEGYVKALAYELFKGLKGVCEVDTNYETISQALGDRLRTFALRLGQDSKDKMHQDIKVFVHKRRSDIAETIRQYFQPTNEDERKVDDTDNMSILEKMALWARDAIVSDQPDSGEVEFDIADVAEDPPKDLELPNLEKYTAAIVNSPAYLWLLASIRTDIVLASANSDIDSMAAIRTTILESVSISKEMTRKSSGQTFKILVDIDWDCFHFIRESGLDGGICAIDRVLTITGSAEDAQCLPCADYIVQTWPGTQQVFLSAVKALLSSPSRTSITPIVILSDKSTAQLQFIEGPQGNPGRLRLEVGGIAESVVEIVQQAAWTCAALSYSKQSTPYACRPDFERTHVKAGAGSIEYDATFGLTFTFSALVSRTRRLDCQCWHELLRAPMVVLGFPILRRAIPRTGLEVPLNVMTDLVGTSRINSFGDKLFIKGFVAMLVPTKCTETLVVWHLLTSPDGSRISYLDSVGDHNGKISMADLHKYRHVVGWCSGIDYIAGTKKANYSIDTSRLSKPHATCVLEKCSITGGMFVTGGPSFALAVRNKPLCISLGSYREKIQWISKKFFLFWDEPDKRGYLVKGTAALLHLTRASLNYDKSAEILGPLLVFDEHKLKEAAEMTTTSAGAVLMESSNRRLLVFERDDIPEDTFQSRDYLFEHRVEALWETMEKLIDFEAQINGKDGINVPKRIRRHLEGWDFRDVASREFPFYHRIATLNRFGKGWVDWVRKINAVTFFGRGFGELIKPALSPNGNLCSYWEKLPKGRYYLAVAAQDMSVIIDKNGDPYLRPVQLCSGLFLHPPASSQHRGCRCTRVTGPMKLFSRSGIVDTHSQLVHYVLPRNKSGRIESYPEGVCLGNGAFILGHNEDLPWHWEDFGDPVQNPSEPKPAEIDVPAEMPPDSNPISNSSTSEAGSSSQNAGSTSLGWTASGESETPTSITSAMGSLLVSDNGDFASATGQNSASCLQHRSKTAVHREANADQEEHSGESTRRALRALKRAKKRD